MSNQTPPWEHQPPDAPTAGEVAAMDAATASERVQRQLAGIAHRGLDARLGGAAVVAGVAGAFLSGGLTPAPPASEEAGRALAEAANQGDLGAALRQALAGPEAEALRRKGLAGLGAATGVPPEAIIAQEAAVSSLDFAAILDLDVGDFVGSGATGLLVRALSSRLGFADDPVTSHQFAFVAYATQFLVSAPVNPNPIAAFQAAWHAIQLLRAEQAVMDALDSAWSEALAAGARTMAQYDSAVASSRRTDDVVQRLLGDHGGNTPH